MDNLWLVHDLRETVYVGIKYFFSPLDALTERYDIRLSCKCNFSRHHQYCHSSMAQYHKCVKCAKTFSRPSELARHIRVHTGDKPYKCNRCPKTFSQPGNLTVHKRACHSEKRPFKCGKCHARFKRKFDLVSHETIHTGEKPFVCSECGNAFSRKYHLTRHMRIHTGVKPYKCGKCGRKFSTDSGLRNHEITHTTKRPFSCKICGRTYTQLSGLKKHHLIVHTGGILFDAIGRGVLRKKSASSGIKTGNKDGKHTGGILFDAIGRGVLRKESASSGNKDGKLLDCKVHIHRVNFKHLQKMSTFTMVVKVVKESVGHVTDSSCQVARPLPKNSSINAKSLDSTVQVALTSTNEHDMTPVAVEVSSCEGSQPVSDIMQVNDTSFNSGSDCDIGDSVENDRETPGMNDVDKYSDGTCNENTSCSNEADCEIGDSVENDRETLGMNDVDKYSDGTCNENTSCSNAPDCEIGDSQENDMEKLGMNDVDKYFNRSHNASTSCNSASEMDDSLKNGNGTQDIVLMGNDVCLNSISNPNTLFFEKELVIPLEIHSSLNKKLKNVDNEVCFDGHCSKDEPEAQATKQYLKMQPFSSQCCCESNCSLESRNFEQKNDTMHLVSKPSDLNKLNDDSTHPEMKTNAVVNGETASANIRPTPTFEHTLPSFSYFEEVIVNEEAAPIDVQLSPTFEPLYSLPSISNFEEDIANEETNVKFSPTYEPPKPLSSFSTKTFCRPFIAREEADPLNDLLSPKFAPSKPISSFSNFGEDKANVYYAGHCKQEKIEEDSVEQSNIPFESSEPMRVGNACRKLTSEVFAVFRGADNLASSDKPWRKNSASCGCDLCGLLFMTNERLVSDEKRNDYEMAGQLAEMSNSKDIFCQCDSPEKMFLSSKRFDFEEDVCKCDVFQIKAEKV